MTTLTDVEREALAAAVAEAQACGHCDGTCGACQEELSAITPTVVKIIAARVAEAVERERAAWATKIGRLASHWDITGDPDMRFRFVDDLRGLLSAVDTEVSNPHLIVWRGES